MRLFAALLLATLPLRAQSTGSVVVEGPAGEPMTEGTPGFTITATGFAANEFPLRLTIQIATRADFSGPLLIDTTVSDVTSAMIVVPRLLPQQIRIWWRGRVLTAQGRPVLSNADGPHITAIWLTLVEPNSRNGSTVTTRRPRFIWRSAAVRLPVKPWNYQILVSQNRDGLVVLSHFVSDTTFFTSPVPLESNTPYKWTVIGRLSTGDSIRVDSYATFTILDSNAPETTILYRPFPNPFPSARVSATCIWFDLRAPAEVKIDVLDLRGNHVARIVPSRDFGPLLEPRRYGRAAPESDNGCDDKLTWNGRDDDGRTVPTGVYLIRFRGDGVTATQKVLWKGQ